MNKLVLWSLASSVLLASVSACGSDSSSSGSGAPSTSELVAACKESCNKEVSCLPDAGKAFIHCDTLCVPSNYQGAAGAGGGQSSSASCDYAKVKAKLDECANVDCSKLQTCQQELAAICKPTSSGAGGSSSGAGGGGNGTGATLGSGGAATGTGSCADCDKAQTCCKTQAAKAGQDPASCSSFSKATCEAGGAQMSTFIQACAALAGACP